MVRGEKGPLLLASLRLYVHYCIDRDTVQKITRNFCCDVHNKLENNLETNNKQTNVLDSDNADVSDAQKHTHTHIQTLTRCACVRVCVCVYVCVRAWAGVRGQVCLCVGWCGCM